MCLICASLRPSAKDCDYADLGTAPPPSLATVREVSDALASTSTSYSMAVGDTFSGRLSSSTDSDFVRIALTAGQSYTITLDGVSAAGSSPDVLLRLRSANGTTLQTNDDYGGSINSRITYTPTSTGTYFLEADLYSGATTGGSYNLVVTQNTVTPPPTGTPTVQDMADQLTDGYWNWVADEFPGTLRGSRSFDVDPGESLTVDYSALTTAGRTLARAALDAWTLVTGISFVNGPAGGNVDIAFDDSSSGAYSESTYRPNGEILSSFVNVSTGWLSNNGTSINSYSYQTYVHEIGHALGLGHAGNYNGNANFGTDETLSNDSWQISVMSYFSQTENYTIGDTFAYTLTPMIADILAMQRLYGTANNLRSGNTTYGENSNAGGRYDDFSDRNDSGGSGTPATMTILDNGGTDTLDLRSDTNAQTIDLRAGGISDVYGDEGTLVIALGTVIENAQTGSAADLVTGNEVANTIYTFNGNDTVNGGHGFDTIYGGNNNDVISGENNADAIYGDAGNDTLYGGQGFDVVSAGSGNDSLYGGTDEDWMFAGIDQDQVWGGSGNDFLFGGLGFDTIHGDDGNDQLNGEGQADALYGGNNNDTLFGGQGFDIVSGGAQNDSLFGGTEEDWMFGGIDQDVVDGGDGNDFLFGGLGNDTITGGTGNDQLNGEGGNDLLTGGAGVDSFVFIAGSGIDVITDFTLTMVGELIDLRAIAAIGDFNDLYANFMFDEDGDTLITLGGGNTITLTGVAYGLLTEDHFLV